MATIEVRDLPPAFQAQVERQLAPKPTHETAEIALPRAKSAGYAKEDALQAECVEILERRGYRLLTACNLNDWRKGAVKGWYGHLVNCQRNPILSDLWVDELRGRRRTLRVELKAANRWQPGQKAAIGLGYWSLATSAGTFEQLLDEWEKEGSAEG